MRPTVVLATAFDDPPAMGTRLASECAVIDVQNMAGAVPAGLDLSAVRALLTNSHDGVPAWIWDAPDLRVIGNFGVGYDGIDVERAASQGVWVTNTPGALNDEVADLALALTLMVVRDLPGALAHVKQGAWPAGNYPLSDGLRGRRLGLLGMGGVGREIAARAAACKLAVSYHCRSRKDVRWRYVADLEQLACEVDLLCCIVPGTQATHNLVDARVLAALGPQGYLINVARGSVVDEEALLDALRQGSIAGAGLDVYACEPQVNPALLALPNVVCLPHVGSATQTTRLAMGDLVIDNILAVCAGKAPLTPVRQLAG